MSRSTGGAAQPHEICGRLMEIIDYASDGPASWYRDVAKTALRLVCEHPDGPPRSSGELLARMDLDELAAAHARLERARGIESAAGRAGAACATRRSSARPAARSTATGRGRTPSAAYLLLDSLALREETTSLARFLFEDFAHYFTTRKPREPVLRADRR